MDLSDILVIKLVPLAIDHVLTVGYVMPTCNRKHCSWNPECRRNSGSPRRAAAQPLNTLCFAHTPLVLAHFCHTLTRRTYCLLCHDGRWLTADHRWWSGRHTPWPGKAADPALPRGRRRGCWSWRNTSPHAGTASSGCTESKRPKTEYNSFAVGILIQKLLCAPYLCKGLFLPVMNLAGSSKISSGQCRALPPKQTAVSVPPLPSLPPQSLLNE